MKFATPDDSLWNPGIHASVIKLLMMSDRLRAGSMSTETRNLLEAKKIPSIQTDANLYATTEFSQN